jgi:hypothetical protein
MSTEHDQPYHSEATPDDRLVVLKNDRAQGQPIPARGQTYLSKAQAEFELGGRYAHLGRETTVVGARPLELDTCGHAALALERQRGRLPVYPVHPAHPFAIDAGTEPPFPVDISAVKDVTKV